MLSLLLLLLPVAAVSGWIAGYYQQKKSTSERGLDLIPHDYFVGLNYLINEQPDKAVDIFIKMLEVNSDTVETHLALGSLFRKRGEVDRAIRVHQNLIARPQLEKKQRVQALSELAQDYLRAGVLDRAERILLELIEMNEEVNSSYSHLLHIYQLQKDWQQAITVASKLEEKFSGATTQLAYYYCELAEQARAQNNITETEAYLKKAFAYDKKCVRASLLAGKTAFETGDIKRAIRYYKQVCEQDSDYISETISPLADCYLRLDQEKEFIDYLENCFAATPRISLVLALADNVQKQNGDFAAIEFIAKHIHRCLSMRGLERLITLYLNNVDAETQSKLFLLQQFIGKLLEHKPLYRCLHCGFSGKQLYWFCPSCKRWGSIKPIHGLEGD
ncbi:MAG: lipopolysaccharide assembly protein LapB [Gammaproteobacteria bacterium]|nr:lipopolysaccharide assembly protein LapB [Gammaproteobacteria bacterium]